MATEVGVVEPFVAFWRRARTVNRRPARWRMLAAPLGAVLVVSTTAVIGSASPDPERYRTTPVGWGWYGSADEPTISNFINGFSMRLLDIEVIPQASKCAVALVHNSGDYYRPSWHWRFGLTRNELVNLEEIVTGRERVLDVDNYLQNGKRRYAVVTVNNQGDYAKKWWWYFNVSKTFIKDNLKGRRIIDLEPRPGNSTYDVVMIANEGEDKKAWWYYYRRTPTQIKSLLKEKKARLVDIEPDGKGTFTIVMIKRAGEYWWWYYGLKADEVGELAAQNGARIIDIERYKVSSGYRYAVVMLNNLDPLSTKIREIMKPGVQNAAFGFYLKEVGGPVYAALQSEKTFEPASAIKVLHLLHAVRAVRAGDVSWTEPITWWVRPSDPARYPGDPDYKDDKDKCAYTNDGSAILSMPYTDPLGDVILKQMMQQSDNRTTDAVLNRFGMAAINATAKNVVGMAHTQINHRIGCPAKASPSPFKNNQLTLHDAGLLYEGVANGSLLGTGIYRDYFYASMLNLASDWKQVVYEEAASLGKSQAIADAFLAEMKTAVKGGDYTNPANCPPGKSGVCQRLRRTGFGLVTIPFMNSDKRIDPKQYTLGSFVDGVFVCGPSKIVDGRETACDAESLLIKQVRTKATFEMLRPRIHAALATW